LAEYFNRKEVMARLHEEIEYTGSEAKLARLIGVSRSYLNRIVHGEKPPQGKVLKFLGFKTTELYEAR
jgi:transcriptional regulator with XRE-family HTH domain